MVFAGRVVPHLLHKRGGLLVAEYFKQLMFYRELVHFCLTFIWISLHTFVMSNCLVSLHHCERIQQEFFKMALGCRACISTVEVGGGTHAVLWMTHFVLCTKGFVTQCVCRWYLHITTDFFLFCPPFLFILFQDMGPTSMPSVPLMVGCGVSCTALLILLLIYAAFWRYRRPFFSFPCLAPPSPVHLPTLTLLPRVLGWFLSTSRAPAITLKCNLRLSFATARTTMSYKCFKCSRRGGFWCTGGGVMIRFLLVHATDGEIMLITLWLYEKMEFLFFLLFPSDFISLSITLISHVCRSFPPLRRYIRSERSIILVNFCLSILASNLLILVGQSQTLSKVGGFLFFSECFRVNVYVY